MTESIIQHQSFSKCFCIFDIVVVQIDSNKSSMSLSLIIVSGFECEQSVSYFVLSSVSIFVSTKTSVEPESS